MKLGIIVPYRARAGHLRKFRESITEYFSKLNIDLPFELAVPSGILYALILYANP